MPQFSAITDLTHYVNDHVGPLADHEQYRNEIVAEIAQRIRSAAFSHDLEWGQDWSAPLEEAFGADNWIEVLGEVCEEISAEYAQRVDVSLSPEDVATIACGHTTEEVIFALRMFAMIRHPVAEISVRVGPPFIDSWATVDGCETLGIQLIQAFLEVQHETDDVVQPDDD